MPQDLIWLNGDIMPLQEARIPIEDRGFTFSDGIYEVIVFFNGRPFMLREHLERFHFSAQGLMLSPGGSFEQRARLIQELVDASGYRDAMVYGQLTRGVARRNHLFPNPEVPPTELWFVRSAPKHPEHLYESGVKLTSHPDERWAHCHYKTISLLPNVLAKERAHREGSYEALLFRENGLVTECSSSNAYCVRDGVIYTHPLTPRILGGVTRIAVLRAARELGIEVREHAQTLTQFRNADEVFISSTTMEVMPVTKLDNDLIGCGLVGPVARQLRRSIRQAVERECGIESAPVVSPCGDSA